MEAEKNLLDDNLSQEDIEHRVHYLIELLHCNGKMYYSKYNPLGTLIKTNASNMIFDTLLRSTKLIDEAIEFSHNSEKPLILTSELGLMWSMVYERDMASQLLWLHTIGPIFSTTLSEESIAKLQKNPKIREKWKPVLISYLKEVPVVTATDFFKHTLMLHYAVNKEYLKPSDITFSSFNHTNDPVQTHKGIDFAEYWARENNLIKIIQTGDIYYKNKIVSASVALQDIYPSSDSNLDEFRQFATIFCGICIRAAVDGGISPDTAYVRGQVYLRNMLSTKSFADILSLCHSVFEDFLFQVHNHKDLPSYSDSINACIEYIESHTKEPLNIDYLASKLGYSKYYLSKKFKTEVHMSINSYIKKARINEASYLLVSTNMDIQEISDRLQFGNRNFFTKVFKEETGTNPATFRNSHKRY